MKSFHEIRDIFLNMILSVWSGLEKVLLLSQRKKVWNKDRNFAERFSDTVYLNTKRYPVHNNGTKNCDAPGQLNQRLATDKSCSSNIYSETDFGLRRRNPFCFEHTLRSTPLSHSLSIQKDTGFSWISLLILQALLSIWLQQNVICPTFLSDDF